MSITFGSLSTQPKSCISLCVITLSFPSTPPQIGNQHNHRPRNQLGTPFIHLSLPSFMSSKQTLPFPFPPGIHYNGTYHGCRLVPTLQCGNPACACATGCQGPDCRTCTPRTTFQPMTPPQQKEKRKATSKPPDDAHHFDYDEGAGRLLFSFPSHQRSLGGGGGGETTSESPSSSRPTSMRESPSPPRSRGLKTSPLRQGR